jgi:ATP citrate (pro-S)-lyase
MARVKLTEFDAKRLLLPSLDQSFTDFSATTGTTAQELVAHFGETNLVVKVDQGIKKRGKRGLVKVNCTVSDVVGAIKTWSQDGWSHFLVEPVIEHSENVERYLSLERMRGGWQLSWGEVGGIEVESSWDQVKTSLLSGSPQIEKIALTPLLTAMEHNHIVFLECNPVLLRDGKLIPLDMAAEIDDMALGLPELRAQHIAPVEEEGKSKVEKEIAKLDASTPASLKFRLINPQGRIWVLLSGGGASLVLADEVADQGMGAELANYGEYSGAPTDDDVYSYTKLIVAELLASKNQAKKVLVIAAGVANFTDVAKTFKGIILALSEVKQELLQAKVKVFVRRGGPNETKGLKMMTDFLGSAGIPHIVHRHETPITRVISEVKEYL